MSETMIQVPSIKELFWTGEMLTVCYNYGRKDIWERGIEMEDGNGEKYLS